MSVVSGITLLIRGEDDDGAYGDGRPLIMPMLDNWLRENGFARLAQLEDHYGGGKHPQIAAFGAGYNCFPEDDFVSFVMAMPWRYPEGVVLIIYPDQDEPRIWRASDIAAWMEERNEKEKA